MYGSHTSLGNIHFIKSRSFTKPNNDLLVIQKCPGQHRLFSAVKKFSSKAFGNKKNPGGEIVKKKKKSPQKRFDVENLGNHTKDWPVLVTLLTAGLPRTQVWIPSCPSCQRRVFLMNLMNSEAEAGVLTNPGSHLQLQTMPQRQICQMAFPPDLK